MDTQVKLEHEVSFRWLIVFALPTILSSIFSSLYSTVDGIFIARLVDTDALSAINITMPMIFLASAIGMMFGSGGNALVAKKLGEGKQREAQEDFSLGTAGILWFSFNRKQILHIVRPKWRMQTIVNSCINGASEMVNVLAFSVIAILFNRILMKIGGSDGVASLTIILYAQELFGGLFRGYINGISSVVSYNLGRGDKERLSKLFCISIWTLGIAGIVVTVLSYLAGGAVVDFFAKNNAQVETIALYGFRIVATSFLMMAYNVFASGWFTALNDGKTSAILSFCRTVIFMIAPVLILPGIFGMDGVWMSITAGEVLSILMSIFYFRKYRNMWSVKV